MRKEDYAKKWPGPPEEKSSGANNHLLGGWEFLTGLANAPGLLDDPHPGTS